MRISSILPSSSTPSTAQAKGTVAGLTDLVLTTGKTSMRMSLTNFAAQLPDMARQINQMVGVPTRGV